MANVFGKVNLSVLIPVDSEEENLGLLQANYKLNKDRMVAWVLYGIDLRGHKCKINVCDCENVNLETFIG